MPRQFQMPPREAPNAFSVEPAGPKNGVMTVQRCEDVQVGKKKYGWTFRSGYWSWDKFLMIHTSISFMLYWELRYPQDSVTSSTGTLRM